MQHKDEIRSLMKKTLTLLEKDKRTSLELCLETKIPFYWLKKFRDGGFKNPSVNRVQFLYEFLTQSKLPV